MTLTLRVQHIILEMDINNPVSWNNIPKVIVDAIFAMKEEIATMRKENETEVKTREFKNKKLGKQIENIHTDIGSLNKRIDGCED